MQGPKTHDQQVRIIEKREKTKAPKDFDERTALRRSEHPDEELKNAKPARGHGPDMSTGDRTIKRGTSQETEHTKHRADED